MIRRFMLTAIVIMTLEADSVADGEVPFDSERWTIGASSYSLVEYLGRDCLLLESGRAWLNDVKYRNCVVEFDVAFGRDRGFPGVFWRRSQDSEDYEHFYMRPHRTGMPDACQYTPVFHGVSGWQLYAGPGHAAVTDYVFDEWIPVRIEVWEDRARVSLGGESLLVIDDLKHATTAGFVGVQTPAFAAAHFADFRCRELLEDPFSGEIAETHSVPAGVVRSWSVSNAFPESRLDGGGLLPATLDAEVEWVDLEVEPSGLANLARVQGLQRGNTCFARVFLRSASDQYVGMDFGYSDRVKVYCNGQLLYDGDNSYLSRDHRYLGTIGTFDRVFLPLHTGVNEIRFAVSEAFGGWGVMARMTPGGDVSVQ